MCSTDNNIILHTARQLHCHDMCKISLWLDEHILNQSTSNFGLVSKWIEISLVGRAPEVIILTTTNATSDDIFTIMTTLGIQCVALLIEILMQLNAALNC